MNKNGGPQEHLILTSNGINGACYAALVLMKFPDASIQITSMSHLESALDDLVESSFEGELHICGVGYSGPINDLLATLKRLPTSMVVSWYAGNEYPEITKAEKMLSKVCRTFFDKKATAKIIRSAFNLKRSDSLLLIAELLEDVIANKWRTELHRTWANRIGASNYRYFFFSDDSANDHTMRALAGNLAFSKDIESLIRPFLEPETRNDFPLGSSNEMKQLRKLIGRIGPIPAPALILGPTGSGKDVVARSIHVASGRKGEYIAFNCAVLGSNPQIAESRLFGYKKGAFTGADSDRKGAFQDAYDGTLFLDEVGELSLEVQAHLLRVLDNGVVAPVGSTRETPVDVRIIAATHRNLHQMVAEKTFREDLLYRLNILTVSVPPLCERQQDMKSFATDVARKLLNEGYTLRLSRNDWRALQRYDWPGNVRQFVTLLKRAAYMGKTVHEAIEEEKKMLDVRAESDSEARMFSPSTREDLVSIREINKTYARKALAICDRNLTHTAKALGIAPNTLRKYIDG